MSPRPASLWPALVTAITAGLAQAASIALPGSGQPAWWLQVTALAVLAALLSRAPTVRRAAGLGWAFATAWLAGTWWWLFISMHVYGGLAAPLAALAVLALAAFLAGYYALAAGLWRALAPGALASPFVFAGLWLLAELLRGSLFTGFPWGAAGYAHVDGPLAALAPWLGVHGAGAVAALLAAGLAGLVTPRPGSAVARMLAPAAAFLVVAAAMANMPASTSAGTPLGVTLLQGNIPQDEKFDNRIGVPLALDWYGEQLQAAVTPLVVAPETAIPLLPSQLPDGWWHSLAAGSTRGGRAALAGVPLGSFAEGYTNSVVGFDGGRATYRYDKHHLVPFGEFIPPLFRWFTDLMHIPLGDFSRGDVGQPSFVVAGQRLAPNVCYEDLFGEELAARFRDPAAAPTIFVNVSNIGWFGDSLAIDQHLAISRMRALEFQRPMLRATNTGATAVIDHLGVVTHALPRLTRGVLIAQVQGREGLTPFARWAAAWGMAPLWLAGLLLVACGVAGLRRRAASARPPA